MMLWRKIKFCLQNLILFLQENETLKNKIALISKELDLVSKKNISLKNDLSSHVGHASIGSTSSVSFACSILSSSIKNDICVLKKSVDCLGSTLSQCVMYHTRLESMFRKKHAPPMHAHKPRYTHASHVHTHNTMYAHVYTYTPVSYTHLTLPTIYSV